MYFIPGFLISLLTFPGVIVHELAHQICCRLMDVPVYKVKYFQLKNPCGYVLHEKTENPWKTLLISVGPFLVNTILGVVIMLPISIKIFELNRTDPSTIILGWLGLSVLVNSFPSKGDADVLVDGVLKNKEVSILIRIIIAPIIGLIYLGAIGQVVWLDFIYAVGVSVLEGKVIIHALD